VFNQIFNELDGEPYYQAVGTILKITVYPFTINLLFAIIAILILLILSALVSGAEAAFFSLSPSEIERIRSSRSSNDQSINRLLGIPNKLLATILASNNLLNIGIVVISAYVSSSLFDFSQSEVLGFILEVVVITLIIVFFGEILPKIYAIRYSRKVAAWMARPLEIAEMIFRPLNFLLVNSTGWIQKLSSGHKANISMNDLSEALDLTKHGMSEDKKILEGIVKFGNISAGAVMTPRVDIIGVPAQTRFRKLINVVVDSGYSRIPVYSHDLDNIRGILYIKDLLPFLDKPDAFNWQSILRPAYYIPEAKMINDLLKEFQTSKIHMAVVIDEYGGTLGIITLEDILEEIVGEISDESDSEEPPPYVKLDERNYLFEGKVLLNDFFKVFNIDEELFEDVKGEADTLAGLLLELKGEMPKKNEVFNCQGFTFTVKSVDQRRIKQIQVTLDEKNSGKNEGTK
jgi:gliding motility-associated protein GldE